jgi:hypothetical protein
MLLNDGVVLPWPPLLPFSFSFLMHVDLFFYVKKKTFVFGGAQYGLYPGLQLT